MKQRTQNPKCRAYRNYGARGITTCEAWQKFEPFLAWSKSSGYKPGLDLDRIDNDRGYSPENCRWVTRKENINNRRITLRFTVMGETRACSDWADEVHIPSGTLKLWKQEKGKQYVEQRIQEALTEGYKPRDFARGHTKKIRLIESGKIYDSVRQAAEENKISSCTISNSMKLKNGHTKAGTFEWI